MISLHQQKQNDAWRAVWMLLVVILSATPCRAETTIQLIADSSTIVPGTNKTFSGFRDITDSGAALTSNGFVFVGVAGGYEGVFWWRNGAIETLVGSGGQLPCGNFGGVSVDGERIAFSCWDSGYSGIFLYDDGVISKVVDSNDTIPNRSMFFSHVSDPQFSNSKIVFCASDEDGNSGIYSKDLATGILKMLVDETSINPTTGTSFSEVQFPSVDGDAVYFRAFTNTPSGNFSFTFGLYRVEDNQVEVIADSTINSHGVYQFLFFNLNPTSFDNGVGIFTADFFQSATSGALGGVFRYEGGEVTALATTEDFTPGELEGNYSYFDNAIYSNGRSIFRARYAPTSGAIHGSKAAIFEDTTEGIVFLLEPGKSYNGVQFSSPRFAGMEGFDGQRLVFKDDSPALYLATTNSDIQIREVNIPIPGIIIFVFFLLTIYFAIRRKGIRFR